LTDLVEGKMFLENVVVVPIVVRPFLEKVEVAGVAPIVVGMFVETDLVALA
jgi:hypothetical protein